MAGYFFDSYALIELIRGNEKYDFVKEELIITSPMNLAEVYYALLLDQNKEIADKIIDLLNVELIEITSEIALKSALFRFENKKSKFSYIDCVGYILAKNSNIEFLTGDKEFENFSNVKFVKK
ncbi:MAG: PIN domain-containing protein [Candidatus Pacearchaeota archaeon]|jgi:predicted nucleic acid-binding protein